MYTGQMDLVMHDDVLDKNMPAMYIRYENFKNEECICTERRCCVIYD